MDQMEDVRAIITSSDEEMTDGAIQNRGKACYIEALLALSRRLVSDGTSAHITKRSCGSVHFKCNFCDVTYSIEEEDGLWNISQTGEHDQNTNHEPRPMTEAISYYVSKGSSKELKGKNLVQYVCRKVEMTVPRSTIDYHIAKRMDKQWEKQWRMVPALVHRWCDNGLKGELIMEEGKLQGFVLTLPSVSILQSEAFIGIIFADGCHVSDKLKSTLLTLCTMTADRIILPLAFLLGPGEDKPSYTRLFRVLKDIFPSKFTLMSDSGTAVTSSYQDVFGDDGWVPCAWHLTKSMRKDVMKKILAILRADNIELYHAMREVLRKEHPSIAEQWETKLDRMAYLGTNYQGCFEIISDSPIESLNSAIAKARQCEPIELVRSIVAFHNSQIRRQIEKLNLHKELCETGRNTKASRRKHAKSLIVDRKDDACFEVTEYSSFDLRLVYNVAKIGDGKGDWCCSCKGFERIGMPCRHLYAVERTQGTKVSPSCREFFKSEVIYKAVRNLELTLSFSDLPEAMDVNLRVTKRHPGRPRLQRFKSFREYLGERAKNLTCSKCHRKGHTARSRMCPLSHGRSEVQGVEDGFREATRAVIQRRRSKSAETRFRPDELPVVIS